MAESKINIVKTLRITTSQMTYDSNGKLWTISSPLPSGSEIISVSCYGTNGGFPSLSIMSGDNQIRMQILNQGSPAGANFTGVILIQYI